MRPRRERGRATGCTRTPRRTAGRSATATSTTSWPAAARLAASLCRMRVSTTGWTEVRWAIFIDTASGNEPGAVLQPAVPAVNLRPGVASRVAADPGRPAGSAGGRGAAIEAGPRRPGRRRPPPGRSGHRAQAAADRGVAMCRNCNTVPRAMPPGPRGLDRLPGRTARRRCAPGGRPPGRLTPGRRPAPISSPGARDHLLAMADRCLTLPGCRSTMPASGRPCGR